MPNPSLLARACLTVEPNLTSVVHPIGTHPQPRGEASNASYDEDRAFALRDEDDDEDHEEEEKEQEEDARDEVDEDRAFALRDEDDDDEEEGEKKEKEASGDANEDAVADDYRDEDEDEDEDEDDASASPSGSSDSEGIDPRLAAGVGLSKEDLWRRKSAEDAKRNFYATEEAKEDSRRRRAARAVKAHERFEAMMSSVMEGMEASDGIVARMDDAVYKCDSALAKKQREIHDEWEELVFDKIQRQIKRHVDGLDAEELSSSLQRDSETYTTTVREKQRAHPKAGVYLDAVLGYDYDPFESRRRAFKYRINSLDDPTKRDVHKPLKEAIEAGRLDAARAKAAVVPRETLESKFWNNLAYTPHGRYTDETGALLPPDADIPGFFKQGEDKWNRHSEANRRDDYEYPIGNEHAQREYFEASRGRASRSRRPGGPRRAGHARRGEPTRGPLHRPRCGHATRRGHVVGTSRAEVRGQIETVARRRSGSSGPLRGDAVRGPGRRFAQRGQDGPGAARR